MQEYVGHVKKEVAGLGVIYEVNKPKMEYIDDDLPPPPPELLRDFNDEDPMYANITRLQLPTPSSHPVHTSKGIKPSDKLYHARPYNSESAKELTNRPDKLGTRVDSFSSSSSDTSNPSTPKTSLTPHNSKNTSPNHKVSDVKNEGNSEGGNNLLHEAMKNPVIPAGKKCENCKTVLKTGEVAISAERANFSGPVKIWHPRCFKCHDCKVFDL